MSATHQEEIDLGDEMTTSEEPALALDPDSLTTGQQLNYYQQLRRIQCAQVAQIRHVYGFDQGDMQLQAGNVIKAHEGLQAVIQNVLLSGPSQTVIYRPETSYGRMMLHNWTSIEDPSTVAKITVAAPENDSSHEDSTSSIEDVQGVEPIQILSSVTTSNSSDILNDATEQQVKQDTKTVSLSSAAVVQNEPRKDEELEYTDYEDDVLPDIFTPFGQLEEELQRIEMENALAVQRWKEGVKEWETSSEKQQRDEKHRLIFLRAFPELLQVQKKKKKAGRKPAAAKGFLAVPQRNEQTKLLNAAIIPECSPKPNKGNFIPLNGNDGNIEDSALENKEMIASTKAGWSGTEIKMFMDTYRKVGKNFPYIAEFVPNKTVADCVKFYYLNKLDYDLKSLHRRRRSAAKVYQPLPMPSLEEVEESRLLDSQNNDNEEDAQNNDNEEGNMNPLEIFQRAVAMNPLEMLQRAVAKMDR